MSVNMLSRIARNALASNVSAPLRSSLLSKPSREYPANASRLAARNIRTSEHRRNDGVKEDKKSKALTLHTFEQIEFKEKESYLEVLRQYKNNNVNRRGHVEFVRVALKYMEDYGVHRDLQVYKSLLDVLPKGKLVPTNYFQTLFMHYPEQQYIVIDLLCKMEKYCVMPDFEFQEMLLNVFGKHGAPLKKFWRMMYWMPKFANLNPWPCPRPAPADPRALARLAMYKITSVDVRTQITEYETKDVEDSIDDTWIVSAMSSLQKELLQAHSPDSPIYVEGPYSVWVADKCIDYFVLRGNSEIMDLYEDPDGKRIIHISRRYASYYLICTFCECEMSNSLFEKTDTIIKFKSIYIHVRNNYYSKFVY